MKMFRILALVMAVLMLVLAFASCGKKEEEPEETPAPTEPATFSNIANPAETILEDVVTAMTQLPELDGFERMIVTEEVWDPYYEWYDEDFGWQQGKFVERTYIVDENTDEFVAFQKKAADSDNMTYKVVSTRSAKVIGTYVEGDNVKYNLYFDDDTPTFELHTTETITEADGSTRTKETEAIYDATGVSVTSKVNDTVDEAEAFYHWVLINRTLYTVNDADGKLTASVSIPRNVNLNIEDGDWYCYMHDEEDCYVGCPYREYYGSKVDFDGTRFYVGTSDGFAVYDATFNYVAEWFEPVNTEGCSFFPLNDGNVLVQYAKTLAPDAVEYDLYDGDSTCDMTKYDVVTEVFSITDKTTKAVEWNKYIVSLTSNAAAKYLKSLTSDEDATTLVGDFENYAICYPIQEKKLNTNTGVMDIALVGNDGAYIKTAKLVENQTGIPEKYTDELFVVPTTYGYAIAKNNGEVVKQVTDNDYIERVGSYLVDEDGIYDLNYESVYNFDAKNAELLGTVDNTIFVKQFTTSEKYGSYTVYAFSTGAEGEPKAVCSYVKDNVSSPTFELYNELGIYAICNPETSLRTYYNADGTELLKDTKIALGHYSNYKNTVAYYDDTVTDETTGETVTTRKYVIVAGNLFN